MLDTAAGHPVAKASNGGIFVGPKKPIFELPENIRWNKAKAQIDDLKPMKSGVPGHARAVAGYFKSRFLNAESEFLYVYDPEPSNSDLTLGGDVSWENWDSIYHTNFIYTDLQY